ncbi:MAG: DUF3105 domain-containing protein [Acidimicrobiia bacterium]
MSQQKPSKKAARRAATEAKRRKEKRKRYFMFGGIAVVVVGLIGFAVTRPEPVELEGLETFADLGGGHLQEADPAPTYNSSPATSGPHAPGSTACGIYTEEIPDVVQVHNLEHGTVAVQYLAGVSDTALAQIQEFARDKGTHILVAPRADLTHPVVVTGWTRMLRLDDANLAAIDAFYDRFAQRGPEVGVPCPFQIDQALG